MESGYIKLPYRYVPDENPNEKLYFDLPLNYKKSLLFDKLPYIAQLNNPAIDDVIQGKKNNDLSIQKFLLATDLLQDTIQDNLDMIATDGDFNNVGIRRALDTKFPSVIKVPTATNFIFRDKAKFDIQNPVIGGIYNQLLSKKQKEKEELETIGKAPSVKDLDIRKRLDDISKFNLGIKDDDDNDDDDDDDDDGNNGSNRSQSFPGIRPSVFPPTRPVTPSALSQTQRFLLDDADSGNERVAEAIALDKTSTPIVKRITFSDTITKIFPKTRNLETLDENLDFENDEEHIQNIQDESNVSSIVGGLDGNLPVDLEFFCGGEKNKEKLIENATKNIGVLN